MTMKKEEILRLTNGGLDVFRHYVPGNWQVGKNFRNPFYADKNASFSIYLNKNTGCYCMMDFGCPDYAGDCFALVALLEGRRCSDRADFVAVLDKIAADLHLSAPVSVASAAPSRKADQLPSSRRITATAEHPLRADETAWWAKFGITPEVLDCYHVSAVDEIIFPKGRKRATAAEPVFLYRYGDGERCTRKLYAPCSSHRFFYLSKYEGHYFGLEQLPPKGKMVVVTGGEKDVLTLASVSIPALSLNSETAAVDEVLLRMLKTRFAHIVFLYDTDETGIRCSREAVRTWEKHYPVVRVQLPLSGSKTEKDISDYVRMQLEEGFAPEAVAAQVKTFIREAIRTKEDETLSPYLISLSAPPVKPDTLFRFGQEPMAAAGSLVCITGGTGTGKSNYAAAMLAGTLNTVLDDIDTLGVRALPNAEQKAVLLFDTEQSGYQSFENLQRLLRRAHVEEQPDYLTVANLSPVPRSERQSLIERTLEIVARRHGGVYCMVIDGLADLISSANDEEEAVRIVEWAHRLAEKYQMVLISIVHTAGMPEKVRGHLGSELTRKASAVVDIEVDKKTQHSVVKPLKLREGSVRQAGVNRFGWCEKAGMHVSLRA